jgi:hypothetical protein
MECRLFFSRFRNETTILRMQEKTSRISASRSTHQADALKLGLQAALDLKKRDSLVVSPQPTVSTRATLRRGYNRGLGAAG